MDRFTICVGNDKKSVVLEPSKQLSVVIEKFCYSRNLDPSGFVVFDEKGAIVETSTLLGDIGGNMVSLRKKDEEIPHLYQQLQEKDNEIVKLKVQVTNLTRALEEGKKKPKNKLKEQVLQPHTSAEENLRLKNELSKAHRDRKPYIMDCFSDSEVTMLFENEIVSRIILCRNLSLSPQGIHPDLMTLAEFLKKGRYLEKSDYNFPSNVVKTFLKVFKSAPHVPDRLTFWMAQLVYLSDWVNAEYGVGNRIVTYGIDLSAPNNLILANSTVESFWEELHQVIAKIFCNLVKLANEILVPYCIKIIQDVENNGNNHETDQSILTDVNKTLNRFQQAFTTHHICNVLMLQYFNQVFRHLDAVMFNELLRLPFYSGKTGVDIKLAIAHLDCWKYENLKRIYPATTSSANHVIPFVDVASLNFMTEATNVLVFDKSLFSDDKFLKKQFPTLSTNRLCTLLSKFEPDDLSPTCVPSDLLIQLGGLKKDRSSGVAAEEETRIDLTQFYSVLVK